MIFPRQPSPCPAGRSRLAARVALAALLTLQCATPAPAGSPGLDWCAPIVVRPDTRFDNWQSCRWDWSPQELAEKADVVWLTAEDVVSSPQRPPHPMTCWGPATYERMATFIDEVNALRPKGKSPIHWVASMRFDLVFDTMAALPGFQAKFVVRTKRPWSDVQRFFRSVPGGPCPAEGCTWNDSWGGKQECSGQCLKDYLDAAGGPGTHERTAYYLNTRDHPVYWPSAALARLDDPDYRAWRIAEARHALSEGHATEVVLNNKFFQWHPKMQGGAHWLGGADAKDVGGLRKTGDAFSGPPDGYDYTRYVQGWHDLSRELAAAGVPHMVHLAASMWTQPKLYDDPSTRDVDEAALVREVGERWARLVLLEAGGNRAAAEQVAGALRAQGREVIVVDEKCGMRKPGGG